MSRTRWKMGSIAALACLLTACQPKGSGPQPTMTPPSASAPAPMVVPPGVVPPGTAPTGAPSPDGSQSPSGNLPPGAVPAQVGVGVKGRSLDKHEGIIVTPAKTLFAAKERVVFDIQIPSAMNLYKAEHGRNPMSHDEFMQFIITANSIQLPQLPANRAYQYDPQTEQLMVVPTP